MQYSQLLTSLINQARERNRTQCRMEQAVLAVLRKLVPAISTPNRAVSVPLVVLYIENKEFHAICCAVSC
jgi:hypothetical protein